MDRTSACKECISEKFQSLCVAVLNTSESITVIVSNEGGVQNFHGKCKLLTKRGRNVLQEEDFRSNDFWTGYKLYMYACYSNCAKSKKRFLRSKMGKVFSSIDKRKHAPWGLTYDGVVRQVWAEMEEYGEIFYGQNWRDLRALMEEFDDVKELSSSENGTLLMQLVEDDDHETERMHKDSLAVEVHHADVLDDIRRRLNKARSNLESLNSSSSVSSKLTVNQKRRRRTNVLTFEA